MYHDLYGTLNGRVAKDGTLLYGCTCNLSIDAREVGLSFDEDFRDAAFEDVDFCVRARKNGIALRFSSTATVRHHYTSSVTGLFR